MRALAVLLVWVVVAHRFGADARARSRWGGVGGRAVGVDVGGEPAHAVGRRLDASAAERWPVVVAVRSGFVGCGRQVRRVVGRPGNPDADLAVGLALPAGLVAAVVHPALGVLAVGAITTGWFSRQRGAHRRADDALLAELPDAIDLVGLAVEGGSSVRFAVDAIARHGTGRLAGELGEVARLADRGGPRLADALEELPVRLGEPVRPLTRTLVAAERYGTPLGPSLELIARDLRDERRRHAEETIRRVPVKLIFPLVCCTLPAFMVLTIVPLLVASLRHLTL